MNIFFLAGLWTLFSVRLIADTAHFSVQAWQRFVEMPHDTEFTQAPALREGLPLDYRVARDRFQGCIDGCNFYDPRTTWNRGACSIENSMLGSGMTNCAVAAVNRSASAVARCGLILGNIIASRSYAAATIRCAQCLHQCHRRFLEDYARAEMASGDFVCGIYVPASADRHLGRSGGVVPALVQQTHACISGYRCCQNSAAIPLRPHTAFCTRWEQTRGLLCR